MAPTTIDRPLAIRASRRHQMFIPLAVVAVLVITVGWFLRGTPHSPPSPLPSGASENAFPGQPSGSGVTAGSPIQGESARVGAAVPPTGAETKSAAVTPADQPGKAEKAEPGRDEPGRDETGRKDAEHDETRRDEPRRNDAERDDAERPTRTRKAQPVRRTAAASTEIGYVSIGSTPYATVYIDGTKVGITPLLKHPLKPGRHTIRAVTEGGATETFSITISPGKTVARNLNLELLQPQ